ncbi:hypothetical protein CFP56_019604 [Quercus suber]|uniref:Uncharacterized protein n=1 Tax=Quercus suber TaxID=58331 RepID=A0AAW0KIP7_QUESU
MHFHMQRISVDQLLCVLSSSWTPTTLDSGIEHLGKVEKLLSTEIDRLLFNAAGSIFDVARQRSSSVREHRLNPLKNYSYEINTDLKTAIHECTSHIGVNYRRNGYNLLSPKDPNPEVLEALQVSNLQFCLGVASQDLKNLALESIFGQLMG